ncbi:hypothetical protein D3C84_1086100 [compost metagenome]
MSYRNREACAAPVGAGMPAKQATRWMAPAAPVFAGAPAPTPTATQGRNRVSLLAFGPFVIA